MSTVFLCHSTSDKRLLRKVAADLRHYSIDVWFDEENIHVGDSLRQSIEHGLDKADYVLVALSKRAIHSEWVQRELSAAFAVEASRGEKVILPILLEKTRLPTFLKDKKYADFSQHYSTGLRELLDALLERTGSQQLGLETDRCSIRLDLIRRDGRLARYTKRHVQSCMIDGVIKVVDGLLSDGAISDIRTTPGKIGRIWREMNTTYVETRLNKRLLQGDKITRTVTCLFRDSFTRREEFWEQLQHHPSRNLEISIRFPKTRPPKRSDAFEKRGPDRLPIKERLNVSICGNPGLRLRVRSPRLLSSYVIRWTW